MLTKSIIEKNAGAVFCIALLLGILFPMQIENVGDILMPLLILLLWISFLNVDVSHIREELSTPLQLGIQIAVNFLLVPIVLFFILRQLQLPDFAIAAMLLAAMPAGLGGPVLTGIAGGKVATSVVLSVVTHVLVPVSVPLLFWAFADMGVQVDVGSLAKQMAILIGTPILLAYVSRSFFSSAVSTTRPYHKLSSILALAAVAYLVIIPYADTIRSEFFSIIPILIGTYILYGILCLTSYVLSRQKKPEEQAAMVISRMYMNNALAIVLAFEFFSPEVALIVILAEIPWFTTFGAYLWFQKKFIGLTTPA